MKKKRNEQMEVVEEKLALLRQKLHRVEVMTQFSQRPEKIDPEKLETVVLAMCSDMPCVDVKCRDCTEVQQKACLISARRQFIKSKNWRLVDDELTNTVLGLLSDCGGGTSEKKKPVKKR